MANSPQFEASSALFSKFSSLLILKLLSPDWFLIVANSPQLETNQDSIVLKLIMMKTLKIMLMMLQIVANSP